MKVLAASRLDLEAGSLASRVCRGLAGPDGEIVSLAALGVKNPYRGLTAAEVEALRGALRTDKGLVGIVCAGVALPGVFAADETACAGLVVVTDHLNLTWRSPLAGPNDDGVGPRFPSMDGIYEPGVWAGLDGGEAGPDVVRGIVAGVADDRRLDDHVIERAGRHGWAAASCELSAPAIVAAHMGLRVAGVVLAMGSLAAWGADGRTSGGRSPEAIV